jgi:hypothetical protein
MSCIETVPISAQCGRVSNHERKTVGPRISGREGAESDQRRHEDDQAQRVDAEIEPRHVHHRWVPAGQASPATHQQGLARILGAERHDAVAIADLQQPFSGLAGAPGAFQRIVRALPVGLGGRGVALRLVECRQELRQADEQDAERHDERLR